MIYQVRVLKEEFQETENSPIEFPSDEELMRRCGQGDPRALEPIMVRWRLPIISFLYRSLGNLHDAEDLAMRVFHRLYQASPRYEPTAKFSTYIFFIARRLMLNEIRRRKRRPMELVSPETFWYQDFSDDREEDATLRKEREAQIQKALPELSEKYRTPMLLNIQNHLGPSEIAEVMDLKVNRVNVLLHRGRAQLKKILQESYEQE